MNQRSRNISGMDKESFSSFDSDYKILSLECRQFIRSEGSDFILRSDAKARGKNMCAGDCFYKKHGHYKHMKSYDFHSAQCR